MRTRAGAFLLLFTFLPSFSRAADTPDTDERLKALEAKLESLEFDLDQVRKSSDDAIDYGGLEVDDVVAGLDRAVSELPYFDGSRAAIAGWSHGGLIALLAVMHHPEKFRAAYAGVPVTDLVTRLGYHEQSYEDLFAAKNHVGKKVVEDVDEYRRRSPVFWASKLKTPLLIHATTNDRDGNVIETENLLNALKAEGKKFEVRIYEDAPARHSFNRSDTPFAKESRKEIWDFLEKYLGK